MTITWLGQNCFKIESKSGTLLIDPPRGGGVRLPRTQPDILIVPQAVSERELGNLKGDLTVVSPGEYEAKGIFVAGQAFGATGTLVFRLEVEGVLLGYLGSLAKRDEAAENFLEDVDVLFVPVGGGDVLGPSEASELVSAIEPRLVVPMGFRHPSSPSRQPVEKFCQAMGVKSPERRARLSLSKKDLPHEETSLIILES
jgi:L-ascorbate metabolism protein UlaG (beta-lactamase superfamily)